MVVVVAVVVNVLLMVVLSVSKHDAGVVDSHGWFKHCAALALSAGLKCNIGTRKSANSRASMGFHSYFSTKTL